LNKEKNKKTKRNKYMNNTPETDARTYVPSLGASTVPAEFARKLERERDELRRMSVVKLMGENLNVLHHVTELENRCIKAERERDEARVECLEQARLLGMSSEREAKLISDRDDALKEAEYYRERYEELKDETK